MTNKVDKAFSSWKKRLKNNRIEAICKPCWEIYYCPYGVLVEDFPVAYDDYYACKVFGHECPVFKVAEPFTETKKIRSISRNISREVQLKVFKRDSQICQMCGKNVPLDKINFDHIIPWSKGGSSDEFNIRLLCEECNKSRSNDFEEQYLKASLHEHYADLMQIDSEMLCDLHKMVLLWNTLKVSEKSITEEKFCQLIKSDDEETDQFMYGLISQIILLLEKEPPFNGVKKKLNVLKYRWSCIDGVNHSIEETVSKYKISKEYYIKAESYLLETVGMRLDLKSSCSTNYFNESIPPLDEYINKCLL